MEVAVHDQISDEILLVGDILDLPEHCALLYIILVPQLIEAHSELIPCGNQIVMSVDLQALDPLSHAWELLCPDHFELYVLAIGVQHNRLFCLVLAHDFNVVNEHAIYAGSNDL